MDPENAAAMVENLAAALEELDAEHQSEYRLRAASAVLTLRNLDTQLQDMLAQAEESALSGVELITFHDGFQYFASAYGFDLLRAMEEEAGSEASAKEIQELVALVEEYHLPAVFTEVNGSDATANTIARETGCQVAQLSLAMDGPGADLSHYTNALLENMATILNSFAGTQVVKP
jgi:ABC-type Zn uptake system ZnuABC Zn-binding protein ZnuA